MPDFNDTEYLEEYLIANNIRYRIIDLPSYKIKGLTVKKEDTYFVLLNNKMSDDLIRETFKHELLHIKLGHLELDQIASKYHILEKEVMEIINKM